MPAPIDYRPLREVDLHAVREMNVASFEDLERRFSEPPGPPEPAATALIRLRRLLGTDPGGAWVAERDGQILGCALAIQREGLWGLSLLVVHPAAQSTGVGRELLRLAWEYGVSARGRVILSSRDSRAVRAYARPGLALHPSVFASGSPRGATVPEGLRAGGAGDLPLTAAVDRAVRGAAHGEDLLAAIETGQELLVLPERGYALVRDGIVRTLAAFDEDSARAVLRGVLARTAEAGQYTEVEWITSAQGWAIDVCLDAGLDLHTGAGAVFLAGDVGPFRPYLPSGAYL